MNEAMQWLLIEGIAALFGAGGLYLLIGACFKLVDSGPPFAWRAAIDPMGWLYGAMVIGIQTAVRLLQAPNANSMLVSICLATTVFCCLLLFASMHTRGVKANWTPPRRMRLIAALLSISILAIGYFARGGML
ncbi:hypothetical protein ABT364_14025 [Massilia sp. SR12]|jgi:ABC-type transport system involved in multi-copper enzyme maturation permease subunit